MEEEKKKKKASRNFVRDRYGGASLAGIACLLFKTGGEGREKEKCLWLVFQKRTLFPLLVKSPFSSGTAYFFIYFNLSLRHSIHSSSLSAEEEDGKN